MFSVGEKSRGTKEGRLVVDTLLQFVPLQESEEEPGEVSGLSELFSACISTDAYSILSVRFLFRIRV